MCSNIVVSVRSERSILYWKPATAFTYVYRGIRKIECANKICVKVM